MPKYAVGYTYTLWVSVEAEDECEARDKADGMPLEVYCSVYSSGKDTGTLEVSSTLELNEFDKPVVHEIKE